MSESRKTIPGETYFVTLTTVGWVDVFTRSVYAELLINNLQHCQREEALEIYSYVVMPSHLHLIAKRNNERELSELLGRFKSFTAKKILKDIEVNMNESRREWLLFVFNYFAGKSNQYKAYHFWQTNNHPTPLYSNEVIDQKVEYIHNNPVEAGIVTRPEHYYYSSAHADGPLKVKAL
jgi:putative transposase